MSLQPAPIGTVLAETARGARPPFPAGNLVIRIRDELDGVYTDADFADLFPVRASRPSAPGGSPS
jgi:transposase